MKGDIHSLVNKAAFTPLSPKGKPDTITKEKLNELKSFAKSPTWQNRNQAISAGSRSRNDSANTNTTGLLDTTMKELDEEMKQLRKTYSLHSNSVSSEGSFKSLVQNRRSDSSDKRVASRSPNLRTKKYPKHKSKQRSASSPVQAKAIHSPEPGKKSEQKIFDIRSAGLLSWNESIAMLTANYKKLEDENLELRRIIHEMSQTETYLVQNAKLEMKIKRLEEERFNLIRLTNELNTLRTQQHHHHNQQQQQHHHHTTNKIKQCFSNQDLKLVQHRCKLNPMPRFQALQCRTECIQVCHLHHNYIQTKTRQRDQYHRIIER